MKKLFLLSATTLFAFSTALFAQQFTVRYNGTGNAIDAVKAMVIDNAGNVYVTGSSNSGASSDDYITIKYNTNGVQQWVARYNGPGNGSDVPNAIFADANGNVYVTGYSDLLTGAFINNDVATVKYNSAGVQQWVSRYDGIQNLQRADAGNAIKADANGNVYIAGYSTVSHGSYSKKDFLTIKYNSSGVQQWTATYNGPANQDDAAVGLGLDASNNIYVTGTSFAGADPLGEQDYLTIKYNSSGVQQWTARYNGPINEPDYATAIAVDNTGNAYVTGYSDGNQLDFATVKYNTNGVQQWVTRYDGLAHSSDIPYAIALDNAGNVYVTGSDQTIINNSDYRTIKYNSAGIQQWTAVYNGTANDNDEAQALTVDNTGNVYVTGYTNGTSPGWDIATIKYNATGAQQWLRTYDGPGYGNDNGNAIAVDANGNVYIAGTSLGSTSNLDFVIRKYNSSGNRVAANDFENTVVDNSIKVYPNPVNEFAIINFQFVENKNYDLKIFDVMGKEAYSSTVESSMVKINVSKFENGIYFIRVENEHAVVTKRIIIAR